MTDFSNRRARAHQSRLKLSALSEARNHLLNNVRRRYLPEFVCCAILLLMTTQMPWLGAKLVLLELGLFAILLAARPADTLKILMRWWPVLITPIVILASTIWSDLPAVSARYGTQLFITAFLGVLFASLLTPNRFMSMLYIGMLLFCLLSVASGAKGESADGPVLIGLTGSKNQMAYAAHLLLLSGLGCAFDQRSERWLRLSCALSIPLALYIIVKSHAATALILLAATVPVFLILLVSRRFSPAGRILSLIAVALIMAPLTLITTELKDFALDFMTNVLHKDSTLTGRTHLWEIANSLMERRPLLGYGYMSIWLGDSADTLGILRWAGQSDGRAFHFHNQFLQLGVDTGWVGMIIFILFLLAITLMLARQAIMYPSVESSFFFVIFLTLMMRAPSDVFMVSFSSYTILLFAAAVYAFWRPQAVQHTMQTRPTQGALRRGRPGASPSASQTMRRL